MTLQELVKKWSMQPDGTRIRNSEGQIYSLDESGYLTFVGAGGLIYRGSSLITLDDLTDTTWEFVSNPTEREKHTPCGFTCEKCVARGPFSFTRDNIPYTTCALRPVHREVAKAHSCWQGFIATRAEQNETKARLEAEENCR